MRRKILIPYFTFIIFTLIYLSFFKGALIDDVFITMRYAKTLIASGTWGFFPGHITNTATSPLNVILLVLITLLTGSTLNGAIWLAFIFLSLMVFTLIQISIRLLRTQVFGYLAAVAFIFNPLIISTLGLESILIATLFIVSVYLFLMEKYGWLAVILGLLTIARADGVLYFLVFMIFMPTNRLRFQSIFVYFFCIVPWYLFSWIVLGSFIPDTFFLKMAHSWEGWFFINGIALYLERFPVETVFSFAFLPLLVVLISKRGREYRGFLLIGVLAILHFVSYSLLFVPPYHWYYVPEITAIILLGSFGLGAVYQGMKSGTRQKRWMDAVVSFSFLIPTFGMAIFCISNGFVVREMPIHSNWATQEEYREVGLWLKENQPAGPILLTGEIGTVSYYCDCRLMEVFSDRRWLIDQVSDLTSGSGLSQKVYALNFLFLPRQKENIQYAYRLTGYTERTDLDSVAGRKWLTSTRWAPEGFIAFTGY